MFRIGEFSKIAQVSASLLLVLTGAIANISNTWTQAAAIAFSVTRILHFCFYAAGITPFRSFAWGIGFFLALGSFVFGLMTG